MIQRLQSVYLFIIILILVLLCSIDTIHYIQLIPDGKTIEYKINLFYFNYFENGQLVESKLQWVLILLTSIAIGLSTTAIAMYKNRPKQIKICWALFGSLFFLTLTFLVKTMVYIPSFDSQNLLLPSMFGLTLLFFNFYLAVRSITLIKKDEELVRSADRIR
jgi:hypothetical protein